MLLPAILSLFSIQAFAGEGAFSTTCSTASDQGPVVDLRLGGHPLQGQPLALEVRGPAATCFLVRIDFLPARTGEPDANSAELPTGAFPGSRPASDSSRLLAGHIRGRLLLPGKTDSAGSWRRSLEAPPAGTAILARGYAVRAGRVQEFEALELDILPPYSARAGDVSVFVDAREELGGARVEVENHTDFTLDLAGWTLYDDRGRFQTFPEGTRVPARSSIPAPGDAFLTGPAVQEIVLVDGQSQVIHLSAANGSLKGSTWGEHSPGPRLCDVTAADLPDLSFEDTNCDGIDGDIARAVFVATTGAPSNPGTMALPLDDVTAAIAIASAHPFKDHVYVSEGDYPGMITMVDDVSVWGGFSAANGWARSESYVTTFSAGGVFAGNRVGVRGANLASAVTLGSVTVTTIDAPAAGNNYGILLQNSAHVTLEGLTVIAGAGGTSSPGEAGSSGWNASPGSNGTTNGGSGGSAPGGYDGGDGGDGGHILGGGWDGEDGEGNFNSGGSGGGIGGNGSSGSSGVTGSNGYQGWGGSNQGYVSNGLWVSNGHGGIGGQGSSGTGGGGGGGGGGGPLHPGGGGGGGGGGAQGGYGGSGGSPGGSSFAVFLSASHASIRSCDLTAGNGRIGGNGGAGGNRGLRGLGGPGGSTTASTGGSGGNGGHGGYGAGGGGGSGGNSYAVLVDPFSSVISLQSTTLSTSAPGIGGIGGSSSGNAGQNGAAGEAVPLNTL